MYVAITITWICGRHVVIEEHLYARKNLHNQYVVVVLKEGIIVSDFQENLCFMLKITEPI